MSAVAYFSPFVEPEVSFLLSPEPATDSLRILSQMGSTHNFLFRYFKICFSIMLPSTCRSSLQVL